MISFSIQANLFKKIAALFTAILMSLGIVINKPLPKDGNTSFSGATPTGKSSSPRRNPAVN